MATCNQCGKNVGCGCNLIEGACVGCYSKMSQEEKTTLPNKKNKKVRYKAPPKEAPPLTEFETILHTQNISKDEKIRRINDILEKARQTYLT